MYRSLHYFRSPPYLLSPSSEPEQLVTVSWHCTCHDQEQGEVGEVGEVEKEETLIEI